MSEVPAHLKFTKEHEWIEVEGDAATIGLTDYGQQSLGELVHVELPEAGMDLALSEECAVVESVKTASEIYSPLSGKVIEVNGDLTGSPTLINEQPYTDGWIAQLKITDPAELEEAMSAEEYEAYLDKLEG